MSGLAVSMQVIGSLLVIVFLAYVSLRFLGRRTGIMQSHALIKVVHSQMLGQNKALHAIVVDEKTVLLIGAGAHLETLARFDDPELANKLLDQQNRQVFSGRGSVAAFVSAFRGERRRSAASPSEDETFSRLVRERLNSLSTRRSEQWSKHVSEDQVARPDDERDSEGRP